MPANCQGTGEEDAVKKYVVVGGRVTSANDGDRHYVSPYELCRLYKVDAKECVLLNHEDDFMPIAGLDTSEMIWLYPDSTGEYAL